MGKSFINTLTPENNLVKYNFYAVSEEENNTLVCSKLILQYDGENIHLPLSLRGNTTGYFRALWVNNEVVDATLTPVGNWTIQFNPNATVLKIKDNSIPDNPEATIFLPLCSNNDGTFTIGINEEGNLQGACFQNYTYQVQFYQPQNIISDDKKYNSTYIPFIATNTVREKC